MNNTSLCISLNTAGLGGVGGGGGVFGQASLLALGFGARSYGIPVIRTTTGLTSLFLIRLTKDIQGTVPSDLLDVTLVLFLCRSQQQTSPLFAVPCLILGDGFIKLKLGPKQINNRPGIHYALIHCKNSDKLLIKIFKCLLLILRGATGCNTTGATLTVALVRMAAYDTCALQNVMLDDLLFSDVQIMYCMQKAIDDWNLMPPLLHNSMTIGNFPYRSHLCTGTLGHLFTMAAYRYIRNLMRHSNAGLTYDDQAKGQQYMQLGQMCKQEWNSWMTTKKSLLNMQLCMGTISDINFLGDMLRWWY